MGIDLITGQHICFGLAIGQACDSCREKYPHLLAKTPEQIEAGKRNLQAAIAAYTDDLNGERPRTAEELNAFAHRSPTSEGEPQGAQINSNTSRADHKPVPWWKRRWF